MVVPTTRPDLPDGFRWIDKERDIPWTNDHIISGHYPGITQGMQAPWKRHKPDSFYENVHYVRPIGVQGIPDEAGKRHRFLLPGTDRINGTSDEMYIDNNWIVSHEVMSGTSPDYNVMYRRQLPKNVTDKLFAMSLYTPFDIMPGGYDPIKELEEFINATCTKCGTTCIYWSYEMARPHLGCKWCIELNFNTQKQMEKLAKSKIAEDSWSEFILNLAGAVA